MSSHTGLGGRRDVFIYAAEPGRGRAGQGRRGKRGTEGPAESRYRSIAKQGIASSVCGNSGACPNVRQTATRPCDECSVLKTESELRVLTFPSTSLRPAAAANNDVSYCSQSLHVIHTCFSLCISCIHHLHKACARSLTRLFLTTCAHDTHLFLRTTCARLNPMSHNVSTLYQFFLIACARYALLFFSQHVHYHPFFSQIVLVIHISSTKVDILPPPFHKLRTLYTASFSKPAHGRRTCFSQPVHLYALYVHVIHNKMPLHIQWQQLRQRQQQQLSR